MSLLKDIYSKSLIENEQQLRCWEDYINKLKSLDFNIFSEKLKVQALIPIGNRILFKGELIHTNEVTVALGADYFTKCSTKQAEVLKQHRITVAKTKLDNIQKEREYLESQLNINNQNVIESQGQEITEPYNEEDDKKWRQKHRENIKRYKQENKTDSAHEAENTIDEELWNRLDELELKEELEHEYSLSKNHTDENIILFKKDQINKIVPEVSNFNNSNDKICVKDCKSELPENYKNVNDMLQQALNKQKELEIKLLEIKNRDRAYSKTEKDVILRLDELDVLDELEDEMDRIDDIIYEETEDELKQEMNSNSIKRRVSFADDDDVSETLELTFTHSTVDPETQPYDPAKGIEKPSDIYEAYPNLCKTSNEIVSILKKTKYASSTDAPLTNNVSELEKLEEKPNTKQMVVLKSIVEKQNQNCDKMPEQSIRPPSLFKMRRSQQRK